MNDELRKFIKDLGFPIVCVIACGYFIFNLTTQQREDYMRREDIMYKQISGFQVSMDKFNDTLKEMNTTTNDRLDRLENEVKKLNE